MADRSRASANGFESESEGESESDRGAFAGDLRRGPAGLDGQSEGGREAHRSRRHPGAAKAKPGVRRAR